MLKNRVVSAEEAEARRLRVSGWCITALIVGLGVLGLGLVMTWSTGWGASLIAPGATLAAAGLAGLVTTRSIIRWSEQRRRDNDAAEYRHREEVYGEIIEQMTAVFTHEGLDIVRDSKTRAKAALWADVSTIEALARWRETIGPVVRAGGDVGDKQEEILTAYHDVVLAMRSELGGSTKLNQPSRDFLLASIFENRPRLPSAKTSSPEDLDKATLVH